MFISNLNNCSFSVEYSLSSAYSSVNRLLQQQQQQQQSCHKLDNNIGYDDILETIYFLDEFVDVLKNNYASYVWNRLMNETLVDRRARKNLHLYNPYTRIKEVNDFGERTVFVDDDELFSNSADDDNATTSYDHDDDNNNGKRTGTIAVDNAEKKSLDIQKSLNDMLPYQRFLKTVFGMSPKTTFETYQKSIIYNVLFFRIMKGNGYSCLEKFLYAMSNNYMGFATNQFHFLMKMYPKKHSLSIIQRGLGKTTVQKWITASAMLCLRDVSLLLIAQSRHMVTTTHNEVKHLIQKFNNSHKNLLTTPLDSLNLYINYNNNHGDPTLSRDKFAAVKDGCYEHVNKVSCASATKDASLRGNDSHVVMTDEAYSIPRNNHATILAMGHRPHCQINYFSSPVHNNPDLHLNVLVDLHDSDDINLFRMTFFCTNKNHQKFISSQRACPNLEFFIPPYITYSEDNRLVTDVMTSGGKNEENAPPYYAAQFISSRSSAYQHELGIVKKSDLQRAIRDRDPSTYDGTENTAFKGFFFDFIKHRSAYLDVKKLDVRSKQATLLNNKYKTREERLMNKQLLSHVDLFVYVDPSYNADTQSGIGFTCVLKPHLDDDTELQKRCVITYMNHRFLSSNEVIEVPRIIAEVMIDCIEVNKRIFQPNTFLNFFVAVENNSAQAGVAQIHQKFSELVNHTSDRLEYAMYLYMTRNRRKNNKVVFGFNLGIEKSAIFSLGINMSNNKRIYFSSMIGAHARNSPSSMTIMSHFLEECTHLKFNHNKRSYSGKITRTSSDDLVTSYLCAIMLCKSYSHLTFTYKTQYRVYPWIKVNKNVTHGVYSDTDDGDYSDMNDDR